MYQKIMIVGNLGRDPELRYTSAGQAVTNFSLATHEIRMDSAGQKQERTVWWRVSIFGKQAEICNEYLHKGRLVFVEGRLNADPDTGAPRLWTGQDGSARTSFDVIAFNVLFIGGRGHAPEDVSNGTGSKENPVVTVEEENKISIGESSQAA